jgi:hypothetical protein
MSETERKRLENKIETLLHGAEDMIEASVAASWLREVDDNPFRARVLLTAMTTAYARIFTAADYALDRHAYRPADASLEALHDSLIRWRHKLYAHTDKASQRTTSIKPRTATAGRIIEWKRIDFPRAQIDIALKLFNLQRKRLEDEAESLQVTLDGLALVS